MPTATSTSNTIFRSADAAIIADQLARGSYQRDLVAGNARWSGADLRGKAARYAGHYASSRHSLVRRLRAAGLSVECTTVARRHVMVVADPRDAS